MNTFQLAGNFGTLQFRNVCILSLCGDACIAGNVCIAYRCELLFKCIFSELCILKICQKISPLNTSF